MDWQTEEDLPAAKSSNDAYEMAEMDNNDHGHEGEHWNALNWKVWNWLIEINLRIYIQN